jgi:hypothetical protein
MMSKDFKVAGYQKIYPDLNLKLKKDGEKTYDYVVLHLIMKELRKGFICKKVFKPTARGTKINFEAVTNRDDAFKIFQQHIDDFNKKHDENITITQESEGEG